MEFLHGKRHGIDRIFDEIGDVIFHAIYHQDELEKMIQKNVIFERFAAINDDKGHLS